MLQADAGDEAEPGARSGPDARGVDPRRECGIRRPHRHWSLQPFLRPYSCPCRTISAAARLSSVLTAHNADDLLTRAAGRRYAEIDALVAGLLVARPLPDRVRPIGVPLRSAEPTTGSLPLTTAVPIGTGRRAEPVGSSVAEPDGEHDAAPDAAPDAVPDAAPDAAPDAVVHSQIGTGQDAGSPASSSGSDATESVDVRFEIRFTAGREFVAKLEHARRICSSRPDLASVLERALDELLEHHDPTRRQARRERRLRRNENRRVRDAARVARDEDRAAASSGRTVRNEARVVRDEGRTAPHEETSVRAEESTPAKTTGNLEPAGLDVGPAPATAPLGNVKFTGTTSRPGPGSAPTAKETMATMAPGTGAVPGKSRGRIRSRHVPVRIRDEVALRDGSRCTYVGPDGVRCEERAHLQVDHIHPFARGGTHAATNLRVRCGAHNRFTAARTFGPHVRPGP